MWRAIGIAGTEERVYRAFLGDPALTVREVAQLLRLSPQRCRSAVRRLAETGLLELAPTGRPRPVDPRIALGALIRDHQVELSRLAADVDRYATEFYYGRLRAEPDLMIQTIEGDDAIAARIKELLCLAEHEVFCLDAPPYVMNAQECEAAQLAALQRGVRYRTLYSLDALDQPEKFGYVNGMSKAGEQARMLRTVPLKLLVIDRAAALVPLTSTESGSRFRAAIIQRSTLTDALSALCEALWRQATPWPGAAEPTASPGRGSCMMLSAEERALVRYLISGMTDEAIARQLGYSRRTLRRRIEALLDKLGAASRFHAGALAAQRGWV